MIKNCLLGNYWVYIILNFIFFRLSTHSQNLVLNPSLEDYSDKYPSYWHIISGTPDIYTKNKKQSYYLLHQYNDFLPNTLGNTFFGIMTCDEGLTGEIIQGTLKAALEKNRLYKIKLYSVKPYRFCRSGFRLAKICLSDTLLRKTELPSHYKVPFINLFAKDSALIMLKDKWVELFGDYVAKGNERYIAISSQREKSDLHLQPDCDYIYYDSIVVEPTPIYYAQPFVLDSIFFENASYKLNQKSFMALNKLVLTLKETTTTKILISGHTDNSGNLQNNLKLSTKRAEEVVHYLMENGIDKRRLKAKGFGATKPIFDNNTEEGKAKNRRIEAEFIN